MTSPIAPSGAEARVLVAAIPTSGPALRAALGPAIERLGDGGFIAYPTETVWGLGACADRPEAVEALMRWKGRGPDAPLAVLAARPEAIEGLGCTVDARTLRLIDAFWPGPLMLVLPCGGTYAPGVAGTAGALGVRCSPHPVASALARALESEGLGPLTSTSLNRRDDPPARTLAEARVLADELPTDFALPLLVGVPDADGEAGGEAPSTVVDCTGDRLVILREGAIPAALVERVATC